MADPDTIAIPDNVLDALQLADAATAKAAGTQLWQSDMLPSDWAAIYGYMRSILHNLHDLASVAVNRGQESLTDGELYVDSFGEPGKTADTYLAEWRKATVVARTELGAATLSWAVAHSAISRIGVRLDDEEGVN